MKKLLVFVILFFIVFLMLGCNETTMLIDSVQQKPAHELYQPKAGKRVVSFNRRANALSFCTWLFRECKNLPTDGRRPTTAIFCSQTSYDKEYSQLRTKLLNDRYRPGYHIVAPEGICIPFDCNGAIFWNGRYHLMYLAGEQATEWWHVSSHDLVHWRHHPPALGPSQGKGAWSGGVFVDKNGVATITYWGITEVSRHHENDGVWIATSTDDNLNGWTNSPQNPVIQATDWGYAVFNEGKDNQIVYGAADPSGVWIHNNRYYMLTGNLLVLNEFGKKRKQVEHLGDTAYLFVSDDLVNWEYLHTFYKSDRKWTRDDEDCMCPDFFPLGDRHMLLFISHNLGCQYYIGRYKNDRFYPETHGRMTWEDKDFFAPESLVDDKGRRIMWAWIYDKREEHTRRESGWSGTLSLPRVLWLGEDKTLRIAPPKELSLLRYKPRKLENLTIKADSELLLEDIHGDSIELSLLMTSNAAAQFGVKVCCSPDGEEQTVIYYDMADKKIKIDTRKSSLGEGTKVIEGGPLELKPDEPLKLRVFIDRSVVEVFANDRQAVMRRIYPTRQDSLGVALFSKGGMAEVTLLQAWDMMPSNPY